MTVHAMTPFVGNVSSDHRRHKNRFVHLLLFEWMPYTAFLYRTHPFCSVVSLSQPISHTHPHIINNANFNEDNDDLKSFAFFRRRYQNRCDAGYPSVILSTCLMDPDGG